MRIGVDTLEIKAKRVELGQNHARFLKRTRVGKCDEVIKCSAPMFSSFSQCFAEFMQ